MEPFVTRIGDVTIERVVPRTGKEPKESIPAPSVSLAKRVPGGTENESDTINVSEDLQIFLKPPTGDGKETSKKSEASAKDETETCDSVKSGGDTNKMSTDEEGCDEDSESEDLRREEIDKTESDVNAKNIVDSLRSFRTDAKNDAEEDTDDGTEGLAEDKVSDDKEGQSETVEDSAVSKPEDGGDTTISENSGEKTESNKRKASLEGSSNAGGSQKKKKKRLRRKTRSSEKDAASDCSAEHSDSTSSDSEDEEEEHSKPSMERKVSNLRRNIREVMNESQLDEETLAAQRQEMERLRRVQEQQRIIREVQRQIALNKQNTKTQTRVISLLQGNSSILKQIPGTSSSSSSSSSGGTQVRLPNTVLVKLASGSASNTSTQTKKVYELLRVQKGAAGRGTSPSSRSGHMRTVPGKSRSPGHVHMMTPSVSIAPVMSAQSSLQGSDSESDYGECSDKELSSGAMKLFGKPKGKDVVTISSSSDDDDCILLSEPSSGDEGDPVDDPTNSGMHTNDLYNVPDDQGRVLVNVGHPPEEFDIFLAPQIARIIKPHQIGGVRFLYDNVVESVERFNTSTGFGCILAHSMGLGKTLQVVSFCDVFLRHTKARTVLCIMPINTLQNWLAEFNMWLPEKDPQNSPLAVHGEVRPREFPLHVLNDSHKNMTARSKVIQEWNKNGGVLLIGYELYRQLSLRRTHKSKKKRKKMMEVVDVDEEDKNKALLDDIHGALVKPGPDLVICDEGHRIKNSHASISQALKQIRSKRRVVLTGYPLQNNLLEYWCMVDFVRPNYLGTKTEFCNMFERPIQNGQCIDSTPQDIRLMRYRAHVLHSLLEGFVQRRSHSVLQVSLPQKEEYVLLLRMTQFQRKLYDTFMNEVVRTKAVPNPLKAFAVCCKIWNHPDVLYYFLKKRNLGDDVDLDLEETTAASTPLTPRNGASPAAPKRGRGRSPRNSGGSKREKKGNGQTGSSGRKPAATIIPNNTNLNVESSGMSMAGGLGGIGHNPHGQMPNMGAPQPQMQASQMHQQSQGFNTLAHQNQSYNRDTASYHDYHQNIPQGSGSSYAGHGYSGSGYAPSNNGSNFGGMDTHNYGDNHYGDCSSGGSYYQSTNVRDQGNYNPYYGSNQQINNENNFQCNPSNSNYWHTNHSSYYQQNVHSDSTNSGSRTNQYYGSSTGPHYGNTDQSYYLNHQQNQNQNFGGQMNGNMYHSMGSTDGYGNNMGHMQGQRSQQTQLEEQSDQRMRNSQSMLGAQSHQLGSVSTHLGTGHGQMGSCPSGMQGQNMAQNQSMSGQTMMNQNLQNPNMQSQNQGIQSQRLHGQNMQSQNIPNPSAQGQNLPAMQGQNLQNQNVQGQNISNQGLQGQSIQNQSMHGQNIPNPSMHTQNIQNQSMQGQVMTSQVLQNQNMSVPGMQGQGIPGQNMQGQNMSNQGLQSQGLQNTKQNVLNAGMSAQPQNMESQNMPGQLGTNHNQLGNHNQLVKSPNTNTNLSSGHCGNQIASSGQLSTVQSSMEKMSQMSQMCNSPTQNRSGIPPQSSPLGTQKPVIGGNHGNSNGNTNSGQVSDSQGNLQPLVNPIHSQLDSMGAMQNAGHMGQSLNEMQNQMGMSVQFPSHHSSAGTNEVASNQQTWHYSHEGMQGNNRNSSCGSYDPMDSYTNSSGLCDVKPEVGKISSTHGDPLCEMDSMYNRFPMKDEKQENSDQWVSGEIPTEQNVLNAPVKCDPADNFENSSEIKSTVKSESSCSMSVRALSPQDSSQSQSLLTSPNKNLSEDSSSLNDKSEIDKDCESSQLATQCVSPSGKSTCGSKAVIDARVSETTSEAKTCTDVKPESKEPNLSKSPFEEKLQMEGACLSPSSERCEEKNKDLETASEDMKMPETDASGKNIGSGTDTCEEKNEDMKDKNTDIKHCTDPNSNLSKVCVKEDPGIPYDWATELLKNYVPGSIENSAKMEVFFCILEEAMALGDRMLVFSQSLFTLNLIEDFLQRSNLPGRQEKWSRNWNYYRLDGSTSALEREKLINEYNSNPNIHLFLVSTRAGSLGINLVGANRVVVFDASWNPCHDTQAVCRVYRYGQKKPCFVYRLVMDNCLEKKIYDRQINKQGMADRVVDECNPDAHLSIKEVTNLCWDNEEETEVKDFSKEKHKYIDVVMQKVLDKHSAVLTKEPFQHESLLVDRKEKKLSQAEKRLAKRSYELEKQANINYNRPQYSYYPSTGVCNSGMQTSLQIRAIRTDGTATSMVPKPVASVRPMQAELNSQVDRTLRTSGALNSSRSRWIPADVWQRQGMSAQEMTLPLDVVIPTNSPDRASIVLKAGQRVMVLKSPKGIYMQLENGKIIAIRTAFKVGGSNKGSASQDYKNTLSSNIDKSDLEMKPVDIKKEGGTQNSNRGNIKVNSVLPLKNNSAITIIPKISPVSNMNRSGGNAHKPLVNKIFPTNIKQEPNCRTNWGSNNSKQTHMKVTENKARIDNKSYFQIQNQNQRNCLEEEFEDNDSNDQQQTSTSKIYLPEAESKGGSNTHSSFSDDGSSGVTNLMMDDKENSNLTESEILIKSPSPQNYQNSISRKEEGEHISDTSHNDSPKESEGENQNFSQNHGSSQENIQAEELLWQHSDKSSTSYDANKNDKGNSQNDGDYTNCTKSVRLPQSNSGPHPPAHSVPPVPHQTTHHSMHSSTFQDEFRQMHEDADGHEESPLTAQSLQQQEYTEETREANDQDITMSTSYAHKNVFSNSQSDSSSVTQNHPHFLQEHHKSVVSSDSNANNSTKLREDEAASCGNPSVPQSHTYTENTMKSPTNYRNSLDNTDNAYGGYKHDSSTTGNSMMEPNKNVIRPYHETHVSSSTADLHNDGRGKCELHKRENCECDGSRSSSKIKTNETAAKGTASNQQYLPPPPSLAQNISQVPSDTASSKKRQSSKAVTSGSETMTSDCTARYNMENPHMKPYSNPSSSLESQHSIQPAQSMTLPSTSFPTPSNLSSENYQMPLHNPHASTPDSHSTDYPHVGNLKSLPQPPTENVYGSSYGQYLGGPTYYGFGQQTTPSMMQFGNHYYGDNQYERSLSSSDQSQSKERNIPHSIGRNDGHSVSTALAPSKKDTNQLNSTDTRDLKQDSKSSLCSREDVRTSGSPGSASGSHSNNNSARSTPAINQTPVSSASTEPATNCNPSLPSALPSVPPANFNPYASGTSTSTASLSAHQNPYESMMLNSYTPGTCQYNIPGTTAPSTSNPFSAPGTNYASPLRPTGPASGVSPYGTPSAYSNSMSYGAGVSSQYDSDYARASMYSAFHRPEPHHFAPGPAELTPPFLSTVAPPTNPSPFGLSSHHRSPHFPSSPGASSQSSNYYPQNMYAPSPYPARPGYTATDPAYGVPYGTPAPTFSPFLNHLHQHPYSTLQHPGSAPPPGPQSTGASPAP